MLKQRIVFSMLVYGLFLFAWCWEAGNPFYYLFNPGPPGQALYLLSKCVGYLALAGLLVQYAVGISQRFSRIPSDYRLHAINGIVLLALVGLHPFLFFSAVSKRSGELAWQIWIPNFSDYYHAMVGFGILAFFSVVLAFIAGRLKGILSQRISRAIHYLASIGGTLSVIHAFSIGSETRNASVTLSLIFVVGLIVYSVYKNSSETSKNLTYTQRNEC